MYIRIDQLQFEFNPDPIAILIETPQVRLASQMDASSARTWVALPFDAHEARTHAPGVTGHTAVASGALRVLALVAPLVPMRFKPGDRRPLRVFAGAEGKTHAIGRGRPHLGARRILPLLPT